MVIALYGNLHRRSLELKILQLRHAPLVHENDFSVSLSCSHHFYRRVGALFNADSNFALVPAVAITLQPKAFATWIVAMPVPPAPAWTRTVSPDFTYARSREAA
jgi:hypothetical protein